MLRSPFQAVTRRVLWSSRHLAGLQILAFLLGRHPFLPQESVDAPEGAGISQTHPEMLLLTMLTVAVRHLFNIQHCIFDFSHHLWTTWFKTISTQKKKSLFYDLLILNLMELVILLRRVFLNPAEDISPCNFCSYGAGGALGTAPLQSHSYEPQCWSLLQRPSFSSVNPTLEKHIFSITHSTANCSFPKYSYIDPVWPVMTEGNTSNIP